MVKRRVKSDDEYNRLLDINNSNSKEKKEVVVSDAIKHFRQLNANHQEIENPFESRHSIQDIKNNLNKEKVPKIDKVKEEIASAQTDDFSVDTLTNDQIINENQNLAHRIRSNTNRLYDDLREPRFTLTRKASRVEKNREKIKPDIVELEPAFVSNGQKDIQSNNTDSMNDYQNELSKEFKKISSKTNYQENGLDLTADFTKENADFLEKINQSKQVVEHRLDFGNLNSDEVLQDKANDEKLFDTKPISMLKSTLSSSGKDKAEVIPGKNETKSLCVEEQLNQQMASLGFDSQLEDGLKNDNNIYANNQSFNNVQSEPEIVQPDIMNMFNSEKESDIMDVEQTYQQPDIMEVNQSQVQPDIMEVNNSQAQPDIMADKISEINDDNKDINRKINLQNTLKLALDAEDSAALSEEQLNILESNVLKEDEKPVKSRKTTDIILTVILIVMIVIVLVLILRLILTGE